MRKFTAPRTFGVITGYVRGIAVIIGEIYNMSMIKIIDKELEKLKDELLVVSKRALPYAVRGTLNGLAFHAQRQARRNIKKNMVNRNKYTQQSIRVEKATARTPYSIVGSIAGYMETQEFGGQKRKTGSEGVPIATPYSAGQGMSKRPRTRLPRRGNKLSDITIKKFKGRKYKTREQKNVHIVQNAVETGNREVFMELKKRKGIFKVIGGAPGTKRGWPKGTKLKMLHDMTKATVRIPRNPWMKPAIERTEPWAPGIYKAAIRYQLKRLRLLSH